MNEKREQEPIYLDYHATTPADPGVIAAMAPYWEREFGNPHSSNHAFGWRADAAVHRARQDIADFIGADPEEIIFTSGATEANNLAILGLLGHEPVSRRRVVLSAIEHKCVIQATRQLSNQGYDVIHAPVHASGHVDIGAIDALIDDDTALVSVMAVNNEIGTIQPISEISSLCQKRGAAFHTDAAQAATAITINVVRAGVDMMSLSSHKLYGPKGIGALYVSHAIRHRLRPIIHGGGQEGGLRSGTLPVPLCVGFGAAVRILRDRFDEDITRLRRVKDEFVRAFRSRFPGFEINGGEDRHPGNLNLRLPGVDAEILATHLQPHVAISTGAACASGIPEPSHVLRSIGLSADQAAECVRIGFGRFTDERQSRMAAQLIAQAAAELTAANRAA
jgi:cysteine desulfurase